ncbi:hypothetical protein GJ496_002487 [Pomphorhynchus laevis]|nr:hypothetical protein GJ496_002487 [Pomphorhynchus laevis]
MNNSKDRRKRSFLISDLLSNSFSDFDENKENIPPDSLPTSPKSLKKRRLIQTQVNVQSPIRKQQLENDEICNDPHEKENCPDKTHDECKKLAVKRKPFIPLNTDEKAIFYETNKRALSDLTNDANAEKEDDQFVEQAIKRRKWSCDICGKYFDRPSLLDRHRRTHTGERPFVCTTWEKPHECEICNKRFTASSNLYYHRMTHYTHKPHKCPLCLKSFPTPGDLRNHYPVHTNLWPMRCPCGRGFVKSNQFRNHLLAHLGLSKYKCKSCPEKFNLLRSLKTHVEQMHGSEQYEYEDSNECDTEEYISNLIQLVKKHFDA